MPFNAKGEILAVHPRPIVAHADESYAARRSDHLDLGRDRVNVVLDEFFDNAGRAFDDFTSCLKGGGTAEQAAASRNTAGMSARRVIP